MSQPPRDHLSELLSRRGGTGLGRGRGRGGPSRRARGGPPGFGTSVSAEERQRQQDKLVQDTDTDASLCRISAASLGYLNDPYAGEFVFVDRAVARKQPIINRGTYVRTTTLDALILSFLLSFPPDTPKQIVSLGAGRDTRYWRLRAQRLTSRLLYHEIDFPTVSEQKYHAIRSSPVLSPPGSSFWTITHPTTAMGLHEGDVIPGQKRWGYFTNAGNGAGGLWDISEGYLFHPIDLRQRSLKIEGLLTDVPTLVISECCLCYLPVETADEILALFANSVKSVGVVCYEPIRPDDAFGEVMTRNLASRGLSMPTVHAYPSLEKQWERFESCGFAEGEEKGGGRNGASVKWLWDHWVGQEEKQRLSGLEMFDEVEEWDMLASHYAVTWAWKDEGRTGAFDAWVSDCPGEGAYPVLEEGDAEAEGEEDDSGVESEKTQGGEWKEVESDGGVEGNGLEELHRELHQEPYDFLMRDDAMDEDTLDTQ